MFLFFIISVYLSSVYIVSFYKFVFYILSRHPLVPCNTMVIEIILTSNLFLWFKTLKCTLITVQSLRRKPDYK